MRLGAPFVAACLAIISSCIGAFAYLYLGTTASEAIMTGVVAFTALALYHLVSRPVELRATIARQSADLARSGTDLARQVAEINRRLATLESSVEAALTRTRAVTDPLALEIAELGTLVRQLAETATSHQSAIASVPREEATDTLADEHRPSIEAPSLVERPPSLGAPMSPPPVEPRRDDGLTATIRTAIETNRIDLYLQPIVTLPQRKVRYYEALSRLRTDDGVPLPGIDFIAPAESAGLMPQIDAFATFRCIQVLRRLLLKNRDIGLFCNLSATTLAGPAFPKFLEFMQANRALAASLVLEFTQWSLRAMGAAEQEGLAALSECGFRFSLDNIIDLRIEPRELASRGFRFMKVRSGLLLDRTSPASAPRLAGERKESGDIHPADLANLLSEYGIDLIAEKIESEDSVIDLLDYDVRYGQGFLFSPPRPVRAEALQATAQEPAEERASTEIRGADREDAGKTERSGDLLTLAPSTTRTMSEEKARD